MTMITETDVPALVLGAGLLGAGGGGRSDGIATLLSELLSGCGGVPVLPAKALSPEAWCLPIAQVGSSTLRSERLPTGTEVFSVLDRAAEVHRAPIAAIAWGEAAGSNLLFPIVAAAQSGLPLVDADGMGRAYSSLVQTTYQLGGISATPAILAGTSGESLVIHGWPERLEHLARPVVEALGGWAMIGWYGLRADQVAEAAIRGTWHRALTLGQALLAEPPAEVGASSPDPARPAEITLPGARTLLTGPVVEIDDRAGFGRSVVVEAAAGPEQALRIECRNEVLLAMLDGRVVAEVPDIICPISVELRAPQNVEDLHLGQQLQVVRLEPPAQWQEPRARRHVDAAAHGLGRQ